MTELSRSDETLRKNLLYLKQYQPFVDVSLCGESTHPFGVEIIDNNVCFVRYLAGNKKKYLNSRKNPHREAKRFVDAMNPKKDERYLMIGMGTGAILDYLSNYTVYILEPHYQMFKLFLSYKDQKKYLTNPSITYIVQQNFNESIKCINRIFRKIPHREKMRYIPYPVMLEGLSEEWTPLLQQVDDYLIQKRSQKFFSSVREENLKENLEYVRNTNDDFLQFAKGKSFVIAGGGPSLDNYLKKDFSKDKKIMLLSTGTALKPLMEYGIIPDAVMITDPQPVVAEQITRITSKNIPLLLLPTSSSKILKTYRGPYTFCMVKSDPLPAWWEVYREKFIEIETGGSVVTAAVSLAAELGSRSIGLIGCDFSHPGGVPHSTLSVHTQTRLSRLNKFSGHEETLNPPGESVFVQSVSGAPVPTLQNLMVYLHWLENFISRHKEIKFYQLSEAGAKIKGTIPPGI